MKIERHTLPRMTLREFARKYGLTLEVHERSHLDGPMRWYAHFKHAETKKGSILRGAYGNGATESDAISAYCKEISGQYLVVDAYQKTRQDIAVPIITEVGEE